MKKIYSYLIILTMVFMFTCCKKDPSADPCAGQVATSAKFQILEAVSANNTDFHLVASHIYFSLQILFFNTNSLHFQH